MFYFRGANYEVWGLYTLQTVVQLGQYEHIDISFENSSPLIFPIQFYLNLI